MSYNWTDHLDLTRDFGATFEPPHLIRTERITIAESVSILFTGKDIESVGMYIQSQADSSSYEVYDVNGGFLGTLGACLSKYIESAGADRMSRAIEQRLGEITSQVAAQHLREFSDLSVKLCTTVEDPVNVFDSCTVGWPSEQLLGRRVGISDVKIQKRLEVTIHLLAKEYRWYDQTYVAQSVLPDDGSGKKHEAIHLITRAPKGVGVRLSATIREIPDDQGQAHSPKTHPKN